MPGLLDEVQRPVGRISAGRQLWLGAQALRMVWSSARRDFCAVAACALAQGCGAALQVGLTSRVLQAVLAAPHARLGGGVLADLVGMVTVTAALKLAGSFQFERQRLVGELVARYAQTRVMDVAAQARLEEFEQPEFYDRLERATVTAQMRPVQLASGLLGTLSAVVGAGGIAVALILISPWLGLLVLVSAVPLWAAASHANRVLYAFNYRMTHLDRTRSYISLLMTSKENAAELRACEATGFLRRRVDELYDSRLRAVRTMVRRRVRAAAAGGVTSAMVLAAVLLLTTVMVERRWLSLASACAAFVAITLLSQRLSAAADSALQLHESTLFVEDFISFVHSRRQCADDAPPDDAPTTFSHIELRGVRFRYPGRSHEALRGIDLEFKAGEVIALVGENGSGKTTLVKIIAGLYRPTAGAVYADGRPIGDPGAAWRTQVAVVFQDFVQYHLTVADNIAMGRPEFRDDPAAIHAAAARSRADQFVRHLPDGYNTQLGSQFLGGMELSGGQWQRLALARAFFRNAALVVLDEPTASLDPRAERQLFDDIRRLCADRTVLLISHRFANVRSADRIYVLADGQVVESGAHDELMALGGQYAELFTLQAESYLTHQGSR